MNHFPHHIGDYLRDTAHLSLLEHGCYRRLLDVYYTREGPLPADIGATCRLVGARTEEERSAVESILNEFFRKEADGWHQSRCDAEIAAFRERSSKASASANARWSQSSEHANAMRTHKAGNANASGEQCPEHANAMRTQCSADAIQNQNQNQKTTCAENAVAFSAGAWAVPPLLRAKWTEAYPAVNIESELAKAATWLLSNPKNRKSNYARFLANWLTKAQDRAPRQSTVVPIGLPRSNAAGGI